MAQEIVTSNKIVPSIITENENGLEVRETIHVKGISATSRSPLFDAMTKTPGMPTYASEHPYIRGVFVRSRIPKPFSVSSTEAQVEVVWKSPDFNSPDSGPLVKFHGYTRTITAYQGVAGSPEEINFTPKGGSAMKKQGIRYDKPVAMGVLEYDFIRQSNPQGMLTYFNRLNSVPFRGEPRFCWHCADIGIEKRKYLAGWNIHVAFIYAEDTHIVTQSYMLPEGTIPSKNEGFQLPIDPYKKTGNGWSNVMPIKSANFNLMGLPNGF